MPLSIITLALRLGAMDAQTEFFYVNAAASCKPPQTWAEGRLEGAIRLAIAETWAKTHATFSWGVDPDIDSSDFSDERPRWRLWRCDMLIAGTLSHHSLGGIDFGRRGEPWGDSYKRVIEAELAVEA